MKKDRDCRIIRLGDRILRILDAEGEKALVIDCVKMGMPKWISLSEIEDGVEIPGEEFMGEMERDIPEGMSASARQTMQERFTVISGILPCVGDKKQRSLRIADAAEKYKVSQNTVKNYLGLYLAYQDISVLAPREKQEQRELTQDEKNMRWALNKFYYTREKQSLSTVYTLMLKERYCDRNGKLKDRYPSIHQLRYFYKKTKKLQTYYISRNGLKDYQRNHRPLLGDGGVYSLRNLMLNVAADKKEWCRRFGILIEREQWDCDCLPGLMLTDMGTEYTSENFGQITELGVTIQNLPAYRPELKGQVEKFFDLIQSEYKKHLKGKGVIEPDYRERGAHDYRKDACLTMRDFETVILRCILYYNSQRILENFPYTEEMLQEGVKPFASSVFRWGKHKEGVNLIPVSREELIQTLLPRTAGRFMRSGLKVKGMRYHADGYTERYLKGGEVTVAYNPEDVSHVWLLEEGAYHRFDLIESRFRGKNIAEVEKLKADCNEMIKDASAGNLQAKIDLAMHIQNIAGNAVHTGDTKIKNIRKTRQREQRKRHVDFMKEGAGNER